MRTAPRVTALLLAAAGTALAARPAPGPLRVCADPNNLPYSNARRDGFENRLAELMAAALGHDGVAYTWWAQRRGFFRHTLNAGACDVVMGVPRALEMALTTRPYYRSTYVFVTRRADPAIASLDDPALAGRRIGVPLVGDDGAQPPPVHALTRRGLVRNVVGYSVYGDYRIDSPPSRLIAAVAGGEVDVAIAWGPLAGYYAARQAVPLALHPIPADAALPGLPFTFEIAMAVRHSDRALRDRLDAAIVARRGAIDALLARYRVPRIDATPGAAP
jgi:mxaJ protein